MTKKSNKIMSQVERQSAFAPETHNSEQTDYPSQAQQVAKQAKDHEHHTAGATESLKVASPGVDNVAGSETDMIDQMQDMEQSGKIDNGAYEGEPNHDDNVTKYSGATAHK
jgi:hypothetical protein